MGKIDERFKAKQRKAVYSGFGATLNDVLTGQDAHQIIKDARERGLDYVEEKYAGKFKGYYNGLCNRSACLSPHEVQWYNTGSYAFYCPDCAYELNKSNRRFKDINGGEPYVHFIATEEEANTKHVMPSKINYATALKNR